MTFIEVDATNEDDAEIKANALINTPALCSRCTDELEIDNVGSVLTVAKMSDDDMGKDGAL